MGSRKVIDTYYSDIDNLVELLTRLTNSYRLLVGSAEELNRIALSKKNQVREALKRVDKLGDVIDDVIKSIEESSGSYLKYCDLKSEILKSRIDEDYIYTEIEEDLSFKE